jgi:hypothetical protein
VARGIAFSLDQTALQDLSYEHEFDAALTVDAMENIRLKTGRWCWPRCTGLSGRAGSCI